MSEMSPEPVDPFLDQDIMPLARSAHDIFVAFMAAGFTEHQAIQVVIGMITDIFRNAAKAA